MTNYFTKVKESNLLYFPIMWCWFKKNDLFYYEEHCCDVKCKHPYLGFDHGSVSPSDTHTHTHCISYMWIFISKFVSCLWTIKHSKKIGLFPVHLKLPFKLLHRNKSFFMFQFFYRSRKTHPGPVVHLDDNPVDPSRVSFIWKLSKDYILLAI